MLKAILITGTSLAQGQGKEHGKFTSKYMEACAVCELGESDLNTLGVEPGQNVRVTSPYGSVVVKAVKAKEPSPGIIFIANGPWVNLLTGPDTGSTGMPHFKGMEVEVALATSEKVMSIEEIVRTVYFGR